MDTEAPSVSETPERIAIYRENLRGEIDGAALYRLLAEAERDADRSRILLELAAAEERHAGVWRRKLQEAGVEVDDPRPSLRVRVLGWLARRFGATAVLPIVNVLEAGDYSSYRAQGGVAAELARDERSHGRTVARLAGIRGGPSIAAGETWHRTGGGGTLRATVFGVNDGLISNLSLVVGVAGAKPEGSFVLLAGVAGLLAGAFSMAAGEYVSMRAQRELFERQIALEKEELDTFPEEEREELALIYQSKGLTRLEAERLADRLMEDRTVALDTLAREELGLDPSELGAPVGAAVGSFLSFALGAFVPVIPFLFGSGNLMLGLSAALSALVLLAVGTSLSLFTGRSPLLSGLRMLALAAVAASVTYGIGRLVGASTA